MNPPPIPQVKCSFNQTPRGTRASSRGWTRDPWGVESRRDVDDRQSWFHCRPPPRAAPQSLSGNIIKSFCTRIHTRLGRYGTRSLNYNIKEQQANKRNSPRDCFNPPPSAPTTLGRLYVVFPPPTVSVALHPFPSPLATRVDQSYF